ncbi:hypothetical protein [Deinococcus geothermalis]|nr:hypothetical protein [Deinococcus geothermalis]
MRGRDAHHGRLRVPGPRPIPSLKGQCVFADFGSERILRLGQR